MRHHLVTWGAAAVAALLAGCTVPVAADSEPTRSETSAPSVAGGTPGSIDAAYATDQIHEVSSETLEIDGVKYIATYYENPAYQCGRTGVFPFVVLEQAASVGQQAPLWAMLHGGGSGYYNDAGVYVGGEQHNDEESESNLLQMALRFVGQDGTSDTFIGDRIRDGDRVALGSLCDHDLMMGLGQPYPNDPHFGSAGTTVDGLLANLAMLDAVENGTDAVAARPTSSTWVLGTSAGSYGAYTLAHNLWTRHLPLDGVIMDSGILTSRSIQMYDLGAGKQANSTFDAEAMSLKHGIYFSDVSLYAENAVAAGFDVPLFDVVEVGDAGCGGHEPLLKPAAEASYSTNCDWLHGALKEAIVAHGNPELQQVRSYPGTTHTASDISGHPMQDDMRSWYAAVTR